MPSALDEVSAEEIGAFVARKAGYEVSVSGGVLSLSSAAGDLLSTAQLPQRAAGMVQLCALQTLPTGWLLCDGSAVSRTAYAALFSAIGTTWGAGDGSTTFNVPDLTAAQPDPYITYVISTGGD